MRSRLILAVPVLFLSISLIAAVEARQTGMLFGQGAYRPGSGVSDPVPIKDARPNYTSAALQAGIEGTVELEAVVEPNGTIQQVRVTKSLDRQFGLDNEAIVAAKKWLFKPGYKDGKPVPVLVTLILEFQTGAPQRDINPEWAKMSPEEFRKGAVTQGTPGATPPTLIRQVMPRYTADAMRQKIQGIVEVEAVVLPTGAVDRVRVLKSLDGADLDREALRAALQSTFVPNSGRLNANPVPVVVTLTLEFRLH